MQYRVNQKNGDNLSVLGFGCMRLPSKETEAISLIRHAVDNGVNYLDTAYMYRGSEQLLGKALADGYRERIKLATKLPPYFVKKYEDLDKIFNKQLKRLNTDYIDYYMLHMLTDVKVWERLKALGILKWYQEKQDKGQILNLGFSYHGGREMFLDLIDAYDWDFTMIQYNFYDEKNQAGKSGLEYATQKGIPVMVMVPLRGGTLVSGLPKSVYRMWEGAYVKRSPAEWALRWVWNHPEVNLLLSGMNSMDVLNENLRVADLAEPEAFTKHDLALFDRARDIIAESTRVACTSCGYCLPCPQGVDILSCFASLNEVQVEGKMLSWIRYLTNTSMTAKPKSASACTKCRLCEANCPQGIVISEQLNEVRREFEGPFYRVARRLARSYMKL